MQAPTSRQREEWRARLGDPDAHARLVATLPCLHEVDLRPAARPAALSGWVRVVGWNVQRGRRPGSLAAALRAAGGDLCLLSELDDGMARTQNLHTTEVVARDIDAGFAFGVEFVELGLGDEHEQRDAAGLANERGLHGNAIVTPAPLADAAVERLPGAGAGWFGRDAAQPRVGGRMAVLAAVRIDGVEVQVASTHLENTSDAAHRAEQLDHLLGALEQRGPGAPAVVAGDFNTLGAGYTELFDHALVRTLRVREPTRFTWPVDHEPLFEVARAFGYEWVDANVAAPTTAHDAAGLPDHVPLKLDWVLVRGLVARRPAVVPAGGLSDHDMVSVGVRLP